MTRAIVPDEQRCQEQVVTAGLWGHFHRCPRRWKVKRGSKQYCLQHDPERVGQRLRESTDRFKAEMDHDRQKHERAALVERCHDELVAALKEYAKNWHDEIHDTDTMNPTSFEGCNIVRCVDIRRLIAKAVNKAEAK